MLASITERHKASRGMKRRYTDSDRSSADRQLFRGLILALCRCDDQLSTTRRSLPHRFQWLSGQPGTSTFQGFRVDGMQKIGRQQNIKP